MIKLQAFGSMCLIKLSDEIIKPATTTNFLAPSLGYIQDKITFNHGKTVNIYIVYEINRNKYKYSPYGNGFDRKGKFSVGNGFGKNCIILE